MGDVRGTQIRWGTGKRRQSLSSKWPPSLDSAEMWLECDQASFEEGGKRWLHLPVCLAPGCFCPVWVARVPSLKIPIPRGLRGSPELWNEVWALRGGPGETVEAGVLPKQMAGGAKGGSCAG